MKYIEKNDLKLSALSLGTMRIGELNNQEVEALCMSAVENGINHIDLADIYNFGASSEELIGNFLNNHRDLRDSLYIQSKCGICRGYYDSSYDHIIESVNGSLERLQTDYLDMLLIHRPDALMEPSEIARAFDELYKSGKVKHFGVSNMNQMQMELIQKATQHPLLFNQLQMSLVHAPLIDEGMQVNMKNSLSNGSLLEYCQLKDIIVQPWSILQASWEDGCFLENPKYAKLNEVLQKQAEVYHVSKSAIAVAWLLRYPAMMQPIMGTTNPEHLKEIVKACDIELSREAWYELYLAVEGHILP